MFIQESSKLFLSSRYVIGSKWREHERDQPFIVRANCGLSGVRVGAFMFKQSEEFSRLTPRLGYNELWFVISDLVWSGNDVRYIGSSLQAGSLYRGFTVLVSSEEFHIIGVSESWINTENWDFLAEYNLPSYSMFIFERHTHTKVGGTSVLFYVKTSLNSTVMQNKEIDNVYVILLQLNTF